MPISPPAAPGLQLVRLPRITVTVDCVPLREMRTGTRSPGFCVARTDCSAVIDPVGWPATLTMMSPAWMPALAAAPPGVTAATPAPAGCPLASATVCPLIPSEARPESLTLPLAISCLAIW